MKKILCFTLGCALLSSNMQVFAQEVKIKQPISGQALTDVKKEVNDLKKMFETLRSDYINVLFNRNVPKGKIYDSKLYWDYIGAASEKVKTFEQAYYSVLDKTYSHTEYLFEEIGNNALKRATQRYLGAQELVIKNYHLEEGVIFEKIQEILQDLEKAWFREETFNDILQVAKDKKPVLDELISALDNRLNSIKRVAERNSERNVAISADNMAVIIKQHINTEHVLSAAMKRIPKEEREAIGLFLKIDNLKGSRIKIASGIRKYMINMGRKDVPSILKLMKKGVLETWTKEFKTTVKSKWGPIIDDFAIMSRSGRYILPQFTIRRILRSTPLVIVGVVLTAAAVTEIHSNNSFAQGTLGPRKMKELKNKIESGDASFTEAMVYYSDERSQSTVNNDPEHLINAINLSLAVVQADKDFDRIAQIVQNEVGNKYAVVSKEEAQNTFNIFYDKAICNAEEGII